MPANVNFDPYPLPLDGDSIPILVYRYDPEVEPDADPEDGQRYQPLPNVYCRRIDRKEGPDPGSAQFEYVFDDSDPTSPYPNQFEQVWPLTAQGRWVVQNDDRLVVVGVTANGFRRVVFDGFAQIPQVDLSPDAQSVTFSAVGVAARAWDFPIGGAIYRRGDDPESTTGTDQVQTDWPTRFNPDGKPNCTPDDFDVGDTEDGYPVFLEEKLIRDPDPRAYWTIGKAVRYLLGTSNTQGNPLWVKNPDFATIDNVLKARKPRDDAEFYDPGDASTYEATEITVRDYTCTSMAWPDAVAALCGFAGAVIRFELSQDENGDPVTTLKCRRGDASKSVAAKDVYLQKPTEDLDPGLSNASELHVSRDSVNLVNAYEIETDPIGYEVSIVLAMGFTPVSGDETDANRKKYLSSALTSLTVDDRKKYRDYVADEGGDGHYDLDTDAWVEGLGNALDLADVLGEPDEHGEPKWVQRLRPATGQTIFSKDASGKPLRVMLAISRDYAGPSPAVWDRTGHWQPIPEGWTLMKDRLGIRVSIDDPEAWDIGKYTGANPQNPGRTLRGVTSQANPSPSQQNTQQFFLRLTCVIEGDHMIEAEARKRDASSTKYSRTRRIDCKDHFKKQVIDKSSHLNDTDDAIDFRDDTEKAAAHAESLRSANEFPTIEGSVAIPWLSNAYNLSDRIRRIDGRDVTFQTNAGNDEIEAPRYPYITGITLDFAGDRQTTTLHYSDQTAGPQRA